MVKFGSLLLITLALSSTGWTAHTEPSTDSHCSYIRTLDSIAYQTVEDLDLLIAKISLNDGNIFLHVTNSHSPSRTLAKWQKGDPILFDSATFQANNHRSMELTLVNPARKNVFASITKESLDALPTVANIEIQEAHHFLHHDKKILAITLSDCSVFYADNEDHDLISRLWQTGHHIAISNVDSKEKRQSHYLLLNLDVPSTFKYVTSDCDYRKLKVRTELEE